MEAERFEREEREGREEDLESLAAGVVDTALKVHRTLGPGLLESVYEQCLAHELGKRGLRFARQLALAVVYDDEVIEADIVLICSSMIGSSSRSKPSKL